jgi:hypothetical protein
MQVASHPPPGDNSWQGTAVLPADVEQQQQQQLDLEQLLQDELAAALAEQQV